MQIRGPACSGLLPLLMMGVSGAVVELLPGCAIPRPTHLHCKTSHFQASSVSNRTAWGFEERLNIPYSHYYTDILHKAEVNYVSLYMI